MNRTDIPPSLVAELIAEGVAIGVAQERQNAVLWLIAAADYESESEVVPVIRAGAPFDFTQAHNLLPPIEDARDELDSLVGSGCSLNCLQAASIEYDKAVGKLPTAPPPPVRDIAAP